MKYTIEELDEMRSLIKQLNPSYGLHGENLEYNRMIETKLQTYIMNDTRPNELAFEVQKRNEELVEAQKIFADNYAEQRAREEAELAELREDAKMRFKEAQKKNNDHIGIIDHITRALRIKGK